ncbi:hypothetical protein DFH06DRAFT_1174495 [Mycena polygramma]|nr:hypothetical protein DFH06DRAFT_1234882 [Mycena polygramma]KAJ7673112.1 hypothetical protein DFH06DRAFT_1174495 [Mycena polygramma]
MNQACVGRPLLDLTLENYPALQEFANLHIRVGKKIQNTGDLTQLLHKCSEAVREDILRWTATSTGLPEPTLTFQECVRLFVDIHLGTTDASDPLRYLREFQSNKIASQPLAHRRQRRQVSVIGDALNTAWESDWDSDDSEDGLFVPAEDEDSEDDEDDSIPAALEAGNSDSEMEDSASDMDVDEPQAPENSTLQSLSTDKAFHDFCLMVPDKQHKALWLATFKARSDWWRQLCVFWETQLRAAFFASPVTQISTISGDEAYQCAVLALRQMRVVQTSPAWVQEVKGTKLPSTICDIGEAAALIDGKNPHADHLFLKIRAQDSLSETLDKWVPEDSVMWPRTPVQFKPNPGPNTQNFDVTEPGKSLYKILTAQNYATLIPQQKQPDSIQMFVAESNFHAAWHQWLALGLEQHNLNVSNVDIHKLYASFMQFLPTKRDALPHLANKNLGKILTRTLEVREMEAKTRERIYGSRPIKSSKNAVEKKKQDIQWSTYHLTPEIVANFPQSACVRCFHLPVNQHCRKKKLVSDQEVDFLKGCGITMARDGARMTPGKPPKNRAEKPPTPLYTPDDIRNRGYKFEGYERDEEVIARCGMQVTFIHDEKSDLLVDVAVYEAFPDEVMQRFKAHQDTPTKCRPLTRGGQFDFYKAGEMIGHGSVAPMGGGKGSGYAPVTGFDAETTDGIDVIFNEVEAAAVMMVVLLAFHPTAHATLIEKTRAADRMGRSGVNTYTCCGYCAAQHEDPDECRGMCTQTELKALPSEYAFCQPSYGYYLQTYPNMLWSVAPLARDLIINVPLGPFWVAGCMGRCCLRPPLLTMVLYVYVAVLGAPRGSHRRTRLKTIMDV